MELTEKISSIEALINAGNMVNAEQQLIALVSGMSEVPVAIALLHAEIFQKKGDFSNAIKLVESLLLQQPSFMNDNKLNEILAFSHFALKNFDQAEICFNKIAEHAPDHLLNVLECKVMRNSPPSIAEFDNSILHIESALGKSARSNQVKKARAILLGRYGRTVEAMEEYACFREQIQPERKKGDWYQYDEVLGSGTLAGLSQRFNASQTQIEQEIAYIRKSLRLSSADSLLDIGGAGGLLAKPLSKYVSRVVLTEVSPELVSIAANNMKQHSNIEVIASDITKEAPAGEYSKILMSSVTPIFKSGVELAAAIRNIVGALHGKDARALISNNFDILSADAAVKHLFDTANQRSFLSVSSQLSRFEEMFWIDIQKLESSLKEIGIKNYKIQNVRLDNYKRRIFDLLMVK